MRLLNGCGPSKVRLKAWPPLGILSLFAGNGLGEPFVPDELATSLVERGEWLFATRRLGCSPYAVHEFIKEAVTDPPRDYLVVAHAGHGSNSYAICSFLVRGRLGLFFQVGWGGVYMHAAVCAARVANALKASARLVKAADIAERSGHWSGHRRLLVVGCDFYHSYWLTPEGEHDFGGDFDSPPEGASVEGRGYSGLVKAVEAANMWLVRKW